MADITYFEKAPSPPIEASAEQIVKVIQKSIGRRVRLRRRCVRLLPVDRPKC
jgi:hypothetical protein